LEQLLIRLNVFSDEEDTRKSFSHFMPDLTKEKSEMKESNQLMPDLEREKPDFEFDLNGKIELSKKAFIESQLGSHVAFENPENLEKK